MNDEVSEAPARDLYEWLEWEDDRLLDCSLGLQYLSAQDVALELSRDPLLILRRILDSEVPEMVGFDAEPGSEEEAEFLALGLAGAPLELVLRWCTAAEDQDDRPDWDEVAMYLTADLRAAMTMARDTGLWITSSNQVEALVFLAAQPLDTVVTATQAVLDRIDVPTPIVVARQLTGACPKEQPIDWLQVCAGSVARGGRGAARYGTRKRRYSGRRRSTAGSSRKRYSRDARGRGMASQAR